MRDGGRDARISFPEALQLANRRWFGSDSRFYFQRPDWLQVPNSKYRHTRLRDTDPITGGAHQLPR
jgi:hypothetical protein